MESISPNPAAAQAKKPLNTLDDANPRLHTHFQTMCKALDVHVKNCRLERRQLRDFLRKRYSREMIDKLFKAMNFPAVMRITDFCDCVNEFRKNDNAQKLRLCFDLYDHNGDGYICLVDLFSTFELLKTTDYFLQRDLSLLSSVIQTKRNSAKKLLWEKKNLQFMNQAAKFFPTPSHSPMPSPSPSPASTMAQFGAHMYRNRLSKPFPPPPQAQVHKNNSTS